MWQYLNYTPVIRRIIYSNKTVVGLNRQLRTMTKSKCVLPNDHALLKMIFLASSDIMNKCTTSLSNWALSAQALAIYFEDRMELDLNIG